MAVDTFTGIVLMQGTHAVALLPSGLHVDALSDTRTGGAIMWFGGDAIMAAIMVGLVVRLAAHVETAPAEQGWLEQARGATFEAHTGAAPAAGRHDRRRRRRGPRGLQRLAGQARSSEPHRRDRCGRALLDADGERRLEVVARVGAEGDVGVGVHDARRPSRAARR